MNGSRRQFLRTAASALAAAGSARVVSAHARLLRSQPKDGGVVSDAPRSIDLWFNELLDEEFNTVKLYAVKELTEKTRTNLAPEKAKIDPKDRTHLILDIPSISPGSYAVEYRVLSRDGHTAPGRITFTYRPKV